MYYAQEKMFICKAQSLKLRKQKHFMPIYALCFIIKQAVGYLNILLLLLECYSQLAESGGLTRVHEQMHKTEHSRFPNESETKQQTVSYPSPRTFPLFVWAVAVTALLHECPSVGICVLIKKIWSHEYACCLF
jgi:hypothetical protein